VAPANRLRELLAGDAAGERLDDAEWLELKELLAAMPLEARNREREDMQEAAAQAQAAFLAEDRASWRNMPGDLRARLTAMGRARAAYAPAPERRTVPRSGWGWAAAAAMMLAWLATTVWFQGPQLPADSRALQAAADSRTLPWRSEVAGYEQVGGQITWSDSLQAGEMRFSGLPVNDPEVAQYQLWIVAPERDRNHPVDGGVFDAPPIGEFALAVRAKLPVAEPVAFAVTLEKAGGVVVSDRPLLLVASEGERL